MKKLHLFVLKSFIGPFVATFFISMFVLIMQFLWRYIDDLVGKGLEWSVIAHLLFYVSMTLVPMGLPLAVLLASIMTFGSLGENYELTALKAAGISLYRIMQPLIVLIVILTVAAFFFSNNVLPYANLKAGSLLYDIKRQKPELSLKEGVFINDIENYSIKVDKIDKETGMMYNMMIYNHTGLSKNYEVTIADSGRMEASPDGRYMEVELFHGNTSTDEGLKSNNRTTFPFRRVDFDKQYFSIPLSGNEFSRTNEDNFRGGYNMLSIKQLEVAIDSLQTGLKSRKEMDADRMLSTNYVRQRVRNAKRDSVLREETEGKIQDLDSLYTSFDAKEQKRMLEEAVGFARAAKQFHWNDLSYLSSREETIRRHQIEWHRKFTLSFACFIFFFIGAPLGGIIRKGGLGMPVVVSIFLFIVYYIIWMMGERAAREGVLEPWQGMWISSVVLLPLGAFLTYTAMTDSAVMSTEAYANFVKKIVGFFKKKKNA
ncbi:YjgP/YjgQ family permease [Sanguibacteroides justesenii]|uniref:LptF/LptG family permease n=1 Tax=Sanguibacteroides justesenii TaxID=1547597 RepID=UPI000D96C1FF|nr:LptF/LptG family permease [Sanguibacteroides justesenii]PXZ45401.1 YjgP/YjgQ family permease [Sanguibacteroides justesenii]